MLKTLEQKVINEPDSSFNMDFAFIYAGLGNYDKAFSILIKQLKKGPVEWFSKQTRYGMI
jgi:hypothetical protein